MTVYILGGGPAGLAVADGLTEGSGERFVLVERSGALGGLAQTLTWDGNGSHDLGPHKLFTLDAELWARVEGLLPAEDWLTREKVSRIFMDGHLMPYPPSLLSLAKVFGLSAFLRMGLGYGTARLRGAFSRTEPRTFEEDVKGRLGTGLYDALFKPIALKLWGEPRELDAKISQSRVQTPSLGEIVRLVLGLRSQSEFEALTFRYPRGGLQRLWEAIRKKTEDRGVFLLDHEVSGIIVEDGRVRTLDTRSRRGGAERSFEIGEEDFVVSTLPLGLLPRLMRGGFPAGSHELIQRLILLNDLLLVFLKIEEPHLFPESWIFVPDPRIVFHRVSEQRAFDPEMTPRGSIVCCEIMSSNDRPMSRRSDDELVKMVLWGLGEMGYRAVALQEQRVIRLPRSYPVFQPGYEEGLSEILAGLDGIANFRTVGRQGAFSYIGSLDAMDIGYGFARWLAGGRRAPWTDERERTRHYPILD